jgi:hypothetical protein
VCTCGPSAPVSFAADLEPMFEASCGGGNCHSGPNVASALDLTPGVAYGALVGPSSPKCGVPFVVPTDPAASYLVDKLTGLGICDGNQMPNNGSLSAAQVATVVAWICQGAPQN